MNAPFPWCDEFAETEEEKEDMEEEKAEEEEEEEGAVENAVDGKSVPTLGAASLSLPRARNLEIVDA